MEFLFENNKKLRKIGLETYNFFRKVQVISFRDIHVALQKVFSYILLLHRKVFPFQKFETII